MRTFDDGVREGLQLAKMNQDVENLRSQIQQHFHSAPPDEIEVVAPVLPTPKPTPPEPAPTPKTTGELLSEAFKNL